jgi:uncharacterized damage-inducible protein DinB
MGGKKVQLKEYLTGEMENVQRLVGIALQDLDNEAVNWQPGGTANSIGKILAHVTGTQDRSINVTILGGRSVFEAGGWSAKTGIPAEPAAIWQEGWTLDLEAFAAYHAALTQATAAFMESLAESDLDREVQYSQGPRPAGWVLRNIVFHHSLYHSGEIFTLKGLRGLKGLPF